jgi:hypothetical protein
MAGLIVRSIDTVDGETTSTMARTRLARDPGQRPGGSIDLHDHDVRYEQLAAGQGDIDNLEHFDVGTCRCGGLGKSAVQPVGGPLVRNPGRGAHDQHSAVVDLEAGMVSLVGQRLDVVGRPRAGVFHQRNAMHLTS